MTVPQLVRVDGDVFDYVVVVGRDGEAHDVALVRGGDAAADRDGAVIAAGRRADVVLALAGEVDLKVDGVAGHGEGVGEIGVAVTPVVVVVDPALGGAPHGVDLVAVRGADGEGHALARVGGGDGASIDVGERGGGAAPGVDAAGQVIEAVVPDVVGLLEGDVDGDVGVGHPEGIGAAYGLVAAVAPDGNGVHLVAVPGHDAEADPLPAVGGAGAADVALGVIVVVGDVVIAGIIIAADVYPLAVVVDIAVLIHVLPVVVPAVEICLVVLVDLPRLGLVIDDSAVRRRAGGQQSQHQGEYQQGAEQFLFHFFLLQFTFSLYIIDHPTRSVKRTSMAAAWARVAVP